MGETFFACVQLLPHRLVCSARTRGDAWLAACYALTPRVERVSAACALLDLGRCTDAEAVAVTRLLLTRLRAHGLRARVGLGSSLALAQLAALTSPAAQPLTLVSPAAAPAFLRPISVAVLAQLHPQGSVTPEMIERLQHYGLHTLGHLARLGEPALRRQFGRTGAWLSAIAAGRDDCPLQITPRPTRQRFRLRFSSGATSERLLAALPRFAHRVAQSLRRQRHQGRALSVSLRWENGSLRHARLTLRQHTGDPALLAQELHRLLAPLLPSGASSRSPSIEELRLTVGDFAPTLPAQITLWRTRTQRQTAIELAADTLTRRHGRPLLGALHLAAPDAIFAEDRYHLAATGTGNALPFGLPAPTTSRRTFANITSGHAPARINAARSDAPTRPAGVPPAPVLPACTAGVPPARTPELPVSDAGMKHHDGRHATGTSTAPVIPRSSSPAAPIPTGYPDPWQQVPQRLHWW